MAHALRFLAVLEGSLSKSEIMAAAIHPEELWFNAYMSNLDSEQHVVHRGNAVQVCHRFVTEHVRNPDGTRVPTTVMDALENELECEQDFGPDDTLAARSYYAVKSRSRGT